MQINSRVRIFLAAALICFVNTNLCALPDMNQVVSGNINIDAQPNTLHINQGTDKAVINWNSFNIATQEGVHFQQPANGVCLNRVDATNGMSLIDGSLSATSKIFLINQSGVLFGEHAQVNVGGIVASTADIANENFLNNRIIFNQSENLAGSVINRGTIHVADNGLAAFLGHSVVDEGLIQAKLSSVILASGNKFAIDFYGDQVINFEVIESTVIAGIDEIGNALPHGVNVSGQIINDGGIVFMTGKDTQGVFDNLINMEGVVRAHYTVERNGAVMLEGDDLGTVYVTGEIDVSGGNDSASEGGLAMVLGANVVLDENANINASGAIGGGDIFLGDFSAGGYSLAPYAKNVYVGQNVTLNADAINTGEGGDILIWAHQDASFSGTATARGGALAGDGGFVEISSQGKFYYDGNNAVVDTSAANGSAGTLLFDPRYLVIQTSGGTTYQNNVNNLFGNDVGSTNTLTPSSIVNASTLNNIRLQANTDVIFNNALAMTSSGKSLTINAGRSILFNANVSTANGKITVTANDNTATSSDRNSTTTGNPSGDSESIDGNITMAAGTSISSGTGALSMTVGTTTAPPYTPGNITLEAVTGGAITLSTPNAITGNGNIVASTSITASVGSNSSISGVISGAGSFTVQGTGLFNLSGANTYGCAPVEKSLSV